MNRSEKRAAQRLKVSKYAQWIALPQFPDEKILVRPITMYDLLQLQKIERDEQNLWLLVEPLIADWTFTDDDGEKLPLAEDAIRNEIPIAIIGAAIAAAMAHVSGEGRLPFVGTSSSAPSPESHAKPD